MKAPRIISWPADGRPDKRLLEKVEDVLQRGALVILPTDTVYGVAADPRAPGAEQRLFRIKRRPAGKPIPLLASDILQVERVPAELGPLGRALAARYWPGPLTMVLAVGGSWEGFRVPDHPVALAVLKAMGVPLRVTSANISGAAPARTAAAAVAALGTAVELAVDAGPAPGGIPSTVVKIECDRCVILREGAIPGAELTGIAAALRKK